MCWVIINPNGMMGTAAESLRSFVPVASRAMLTEKTKLWDKLKFESKWNLRDIMRRKSRSIVTLIGVMGCMVLMVAAIVPGIVVLYNLGVMSYKERYREMATLKVVGFRDRKLKGLLIGQSVWITVVGIVAGFLPATAYSSCL